MESPIIQVMIDQDFVRRLAEAEVKRLVQDVEPGAWWDMKRLEAETCRKRDWLIANILLNPVYQQDMKGISNGGEGGRWMFKASGMRKFLDTHFENLNSHPSKLVR